jgi:hypothetical protein
MPSCIISGDWQVSTINPGFHRTEMNNVAVETLRASWDRTPEEIRKQYGEEYIKGASMFVKAFTNDMAYNPVHVVNVRFCLLCLGPF